jgi:hypothetical protein
VVPAVGMHVLVRALAIALLCAAVAQAAERRVSVVLAPGLEPELAAQLRLTIAGQLADLVRVEWTPSDAPCHARVVRDGDGLRVVLSSAHEYSERRLSAEDAELAAGEVASVVRAYVIAFQARAPAAASAPVQWSGSALYTGSAYARELAWQSGFRVEGALSYRWLRAGVGYGFHPPAEVEHGLASIRVRDHGLYACLGAERRGTRLGGGVELLAGALGTRRSTSASLLTETGDSRYWNPSLGLRLRGRVRLLGGLWFELLPTLDLTLGRPNAEILGAADARVLSPRSLQARLDVGLTVGPF